MAESSAADPPAPRRVSARAVGPHAVPDRSLRQPGRSPHGRWAGAPNTLYARGPAPFTSTVSSRAAPSNHAPATASCHGRSTPMTLDPASGLMMGRGHSAGIDHGEVPQSQVTSKHEPSHPGALGGKAPGLRRAPAWGGPLVGRDLLGCVLASARGCMRGSRWFQSAAALVVRCWGSAACDECDRATDLSAAVVCGRGGVVASRGGVGRIPV